MSEKLCLSKMKEPFFESFIVISISSPDRKGIRLYNPFMREALYLQFYDLDTKPLDKFFYTVNGTKEKFVLFNKKDAKNILQFVKKYEKEVDLIIVNCGAGISRSAGVAAALSFIYNGDNSFYFRQYSPNKLVYRIILNEYNKGKNNGIVC